MFRGQDLRVREEILAVWVGPVWRAGLGFSGPPRRQAHPCAEEGNGAVTGGGGHRARRPGKQPSSRQRVASTWRAVTGKSDRSKPVTAPGTDYAGGRTGGIITSATTPARRTPLRRTHSDLPSGRFLPPGRQIRHDSTRPTRTRRRAGGATPLGPPVLGSGANASYTRNRQRRPAFPGSVVRWVVQVTVYGRGRTSWCSAWSTRASRSSSPTPAAPACRCTSR